MGYKVQRTVYKLVFKDEKYNGLEVVVRSVPLGTLVEVQEEGALTGKSGLFKTCQLLADNIVQWNVEYDDSDAIMPHDMPALLNMESDFILDIVNAWTQAITGVDDELGKDSKNGASMAELNLPMVPISQNQ